jgi:hypothetical protein
MIVDEFLEAVEQVLLSRQLSAVERLILRQSWLGQTYSEMAEDSAYCSAHIKEIGCRLWHDLSETLGEKVTKKNLHLVWNQYQRNWTDERQSRTPQEFQTYIRIKEDVPALVKQPELEFPSSPVPLDSPLYIYQSPPN